MIDRHREAIAAALRERGLVVRTDVGLSEFRVDLSVSRLVDPETPVMAVLLDGPAWARRGTVGDRDGLPVEVLGEMLRWPVVERVWLPSWLADRPPTWSTGWWPRWRRRRRRSPPPIILPTAAIESFKGVAALRASVTSSVAVPAARPPGRGEARRPEAGRAGAAGRRGAVRAVDPEDGRRQVGARRAAGGEGRRGWCAGCWRPASRPRGRCTSTGWPS